MTGDQAVILVVEDDAPIRRFVRTSLTDSGYRVIEAGTLKSGKELASSERPDLIVLDLGLPDGDGLGLVDWFRDWSRAPIIILSARDQEREKVAALDRGADDYLTKPFGVGELLARIRAALRSYARTGSDMSETTFRSGDLCVDLAARRVRIRQEPVRLTPIEYRLLVTLVRHAGRVLTHRFILREVWGPGHSDDPRYVRVFIAGLRRKIEPDPARPRYVVTELGVGYRLIEDDDQAPPP